MDYAAADQLLDTTTRLRHERLGNWRSLSETKLALAFSGGVALLVLFSTASFGWAIATFIASFMLYFGTGIWLLVRLMLTRTLAQSASDEARRVLVAFAGRKLEPLDCGATFHDKLCVGTAIGWDGISLFVLDKGEAFEVPLSLVREWKWSIQPRQVLSTFGNTAFGVRNDVDRANADSLARAHQSSGMFLFLHEHEHPLVQFTCADQAVLERWHEFLTQVFEVRAEEQAVKERERAEAQAAQDRIAALPSVQGIQLGMGLAEAEVVARAAYDRREDEGHGRRFVRDNGDALVIEGDEEGRVAIVSSVQMTAAGYAAVRASLERKYGAVLAMRDGQMEFAAASRDELPASLVAEISEEGGNTRLTVRLELVAETVPGLRL